MRSEKNKRYDLDNDGVVSDMEVTKSERLIDLETREMKSEAQRKMSWTAMVTMIIYTAVLFSPIISIDRLEQLSDIMPLFYIAQAGIIGAYFGSVAWMHSGR